MTLELTGGETRHEEKADEQVCGIAACDRYGCPD
jgi:hypothetical protein